MDTKEDHLQREYSTPKKLLSFSIENILRKDSKKGNDVLEQPRTTSAPTTPKDVQYEVKNRTHNNGSLLNDLPWLSYTRYSPPKLPRARRRKCSKRKSSGNPRVPFSTSQLMTLEHKYFETRYLSGSEVADLSTALRLSEHRVKIWFQNRRAREKKSGQSSWNTNDDIISFGNPTNVHAGSCFISGWFGTI